MNEHENHDKTGGKGVRLEDDSLDLGSMDSAEFDPFGETDFGDNPVPEPKKSEKAKPVASPLVAAMDAAETKDAETAQKGLIEKAPVFSYAAASEEITDTSITFEELRIEKSLDFPELEDGKRVSWTVEYGKYTKPVLSPRGTTIAKMKNEIESSKDFLEALKKSKDKDPVCKLVPKITAQSKGKGLVSAYKGVFPTLEAADDSGKMITYFPARDGRVYEMRRNAMGKFITPMTGNEMLSDVKAGFTPALPLIPCSLLLSIIGFFRIMAVRGNYEALANVFWDKETAAYVIDVPKQTVSPFSVECEPSSGYDNERYIHYMDIHSHNKMKAFFSKTDDNDERATRVYAVVGNVLSCLPEIKTRISNGGTYHEIEPHTVFESLDFSEHAHLSWLEQVECRAGSKEPDDAELLELCKLFRIDGDSK